MKALYLDVSRWLDSNRWPLESEATALPTEPHPLSISFPFYLFKDDLPSSDIFFSSVSMDIRRDGCNNRDGNSDFSPILQSHLRHYFSIRSIPSPKIGSSGVVVMGGDSCSKGCGFESQHHVLNGHFSHLFDVKLRRLFEKTKIN